MNSLVLLVLTAFVTIVASETVGANKGTLKWLSFLRHTGPASTDLEIIERL